MQFMIRLIILKNEKSDYKYGINHNFARIRINLYNSLPIEKILTFYNTHLISC